MKKTFLLLVVTLSFFSCSKSDDNTENQLDINYQNMSGKWYLSSIILADGSTVPYVGKCSTLKDNNVLTQLTQIYEYHYYNTCIDASSGYQTISSDGYYFQGNLVKNANGIFGYANLAITES